MSGRRAPPGGWSGGVLGLDGVLGEVDVVADRPFGGLDPVLELGHPLFQQGDPGLGLVGPLGAGDLGVAKLALERGEEVEGVSASVGPSDLPLLLAEEGGELGVIVGVSFAAVGHVVGRPDEDQVGEIDVAEPGAKL